MKTTFREPILTFDVEDDVTYKDTALKRFTAVFSLKGMCIMFR